MMIESLISNRSEKKLDRSERDISYSNNRRNSQRSILYHLSPQFKTKIERFTEGNPSNCNQQISGDLNHKSKLISSLLTKKVKVSNKLLNNTSIGLSDESAVFNTLTQSNLTTKRVDITKEIVNEYVAKSKLCLDILSTSKPGNNKLGRFQRIIEFTINQMIDQASSVHKEGNLLSWMTEWVRGCLAVLREGTIFIKEENQDKKTVFKKIVRTIKRLDSSAHESIKFKADSIHTLLDDLDLLIDDNLKKTIVHDFQTKNKLKSINKVVEDIYSKNSVEKIQLEYDNYVASSKKHISDLNEKILFLEARNIRNLNFCQQMTEKTESTIHSHIELQSKHVLLSDDLEITKNRLAVSEKLKSQYFEITQMQFQEIIQINKSIKSLRIEAKRLIAEHDSLRKQVEVLCNERQISSLIEKEKNFNADKRVLKSVQQIRPITLVFSGMRPRMTIDEKTLIQDKQLVSLESKIMKPSFKFLISEK